MRYGNSRLLVLVLPGALVGAMGAWAAAQQDTPAPSNAPDQVVIKRQALQLLAPERYKVALALEPVRSVDLASLTDGVVDALRMKPGDKAGAQAEVVQLDRREQQLLVERAQANLRAAEIDLRMAQQKGQDAADLAQARLEAAKADLELAKLYYERGSIRAPFAGQVFRIPVVEDQYVRAGDALVTIGDTSRLKVEIPVDRTKVKVGDTVELRVEDKTVQGKIESILPLGEKFHPLRELVNTVASAVAVVDNSSGAHLAGQTVYAPLMPRDPVTEIPTGALANAPEGKRKVQVVRDSVVRDVIVEPLGQIGADRVYVSGAFAPADELIVSLSNPLPDGTQIQAAAAAPAPSAAASRGGPASRPLGNGAPTQPKSAF